MQETWVRFLGQEDPWRRRKRQPTLIFILPADSHRQRSLAGYSPRGRKRESATTEVTEQNTSTQTYLYLFINRLTDLSNIICLISSNPKSLGFILSPQFPPNSPRHFKALWRSYWQEGYKEEVLGVFPPPANGPIWLWRGTERRKVSSDLAVFPFFTLTALLRSSYQHCKCLRYRTQVLTFVYPREITTLSIQWAHRSPQRLLGLLLSLPVLLPCPALPFSVSPGNHWSAFCHYWLAPIS